MDRIIAGSPAVVASAMFLMRRQSVAISFVRDLGSFYKQKGKKEGFQGFHRS